MTNLAAGHDRRALEPRPNAEHVGSAPPAHVAPAGRRPCRSSPVPAPDLARCSSGRARRHGDAGAARRAIGADRPDQPRRAARPRSRSSGCAGARVEHGTAAVCIYPAQYRAGPAAAGGAPCAWPTVANFPHGGDDIAAAAEETAAAVAAGADEVDVVAPIEAILDGDVGLVGELVEACRAAAGPGHHAQADPGDRRAAASPT